MHVRFLGLILLCAACGRDVSEPDGPAPESAAPPQTPRSPTGTAATLPATREPIATHFESAVRPLSREVIAAVARASERYPGHVRQLKAAMARWCSDYPGYSPLVLVETMATLRILPVTGGVVLAEGQPPVVGSFFEPESHTVFIDVDVVARAHESAGKRGGIATAYCIAYPLADAALRMNAGYSGDERIQGGVSIERVAGAITRGYLFPGSGPDDLPSDGIAAATPAAREALAAVEREHSGATVRLRYRPRGDDSADGDAEFGAGFRNPRSINATPAER